MRIAFLGTPDFAIPALDMLLGVGHEVHVFTQPDRPVGRHAVLTPPAVKRYALAHGVPVSQFDRIRSIEGVAALRAFMPDLMVTAAFGQMLSAENLSIPKRGCINVHGSLLPKYRGAAPIQWAIVNGERETGVTTMFTDIGMDTGDILLYEKTEIDQNETAGELYARLAILGAETLKRTIDALENGTLVRVKQDESQATTCPLLKKEHGRIDFSQTALQIHNLVRGMNPWPMAYARKAGEPMRVISTRLCDRPRPTGLPTGAVFCGHNSDLFVCCRDAPLEILELQASGGKRLDVKSFLAGNKAEGMVLT